MSDDAGAPSSASGPTSAASSKAQAEVVARAAKFDALVRDLIVDVSKEGNLGAKSILKRLISHGADFNMKDRKGNNVLHRLCKHKCIDAGLIESVLATGVDVNAVDENGRTALFLLFLSTHDFGDPPYYKDMGARLAVMRMLLDKGADVNIKDRSETSILNQLCGEVTEDYDPLLPVIKALIAAGADVNSCEDEGYSPLHKIQWQEGRCVTEIIELLLDKGADVNARLAAGDTPLHGAASVAAARLLIARGADVDAVDEDGYTPITSALFSNRSGEVVALLVQYSADVSDRLMVGARQRAEYCPPGSTPETILHDQLMKVMGKPVADLLEDRPIPGDYRRFLRWATTSPEGLMLLEEAKAKKAAQASKEAKSGAGGAVRKAEAGGASSGDGSTEASRLRDLKLGPLGDNGWERRKHLVCCYVKTREARRGGAAKKAKL